MELQHNFSLVNGFSLRIEYKKITDPLSLHIKGPLRVVDIPGNERLRGRFLDQYKYVAKGVVYVIDSCTAQKDIRDVAE